VRTCIFSHRMVQDICVEKQRFSILVTASAIPTGGENDVGA
jgi:hypothetical protein